LICERGCFNEKQAIKLHPYGRIRLLEMGFDVQTEAGHYSKADVHFDWVPDLASVLIITSRLNLSLAGFVFSASTMADKLTQLQDAVDQVMRALNTQRFILTAYHSLQTNL